VIRGEADLALSQQRQAVEYRDSLAVILDESRRLSRLVDDLLNLARADSGKVLLRRENLYLNDLTADCVKAYQKTAAARGIRLNFRGDGDAPYHGDEALLRRMVANLVDNGIRYTNQGGSVTVSVEGGAANTAIRVADTGMGIPPEAVERIFERFYRVDKARPREAGGFGLGLSIVRFIAEAHGGSVGVESRAGEGSVFTVTL
jgi:two-component system, OmpR family, sensor kinase